MVSIEDSRQDWRLLGVSASSHSSVKLERKIGRSMRTVRSSLSHAAQVEKESAEIALTDSIVDFRLLELATGDGNDRRNSSLSTVDMLDVSQSFSDLSVCSSDISGELERLATIPSPGYGNFRSPDQFGSFGSSDLRSEVESTQADLCGTISFEDLKQTAQACVRSLHSSSSVDHRSAAEKLRLLAKNRMENRAVIGSSGAVPALVSLLRSPDPLTQEHAVTALLNLSLFEPNKRLITDAAAIKPLIYALKTGTSVSKQNAACALLNLSMIEENRLSIGACGAISPLVAMLTGSSTRGKKDAMTTLYKLCGAWQNKERAVLAGAVAPLVAMVGEQRGGVSEKAIVLLNILAGIPAGQTAIVEEGGIASLVEAIEGGSAKGKEFAVSSLLQLCGDSLENRALLVREGGIPPLVALSQSCTARANCKAEALLRLLREHRQEGSSSCS